MADPFLTMYTGLANDVAAKTGMDPSVVLGIIDTETGHGQRMLSNNIFGITPSSGVAKYPDIQTAANTFVNLMNSPRYAGVAASPTPQAQATALVRGGYNTVNPNYASIVGNRALNYGKQLGYNDPAPSNAPATPAASARGSTAPSPFDLDDDTGTAAPPPAVTPAPAAPVTDMDRVAALVTDGKANPGPLTGPPVGTSPAATATPPAVTPAPAAPVTDMDRVTKLVADGKAAPGPLTGPPIASPAAPQPPSPSVDDYGRPMPDFSGGTSTPLPGQDIANRIFGAAAQGWRDTEPALTPKGQAAVGSAGSFLSSALLDNPRRAINALTTGISQGVDEATTAAGAPRLGEDINMLAQVAPVAGIPGMAGPAGVPRASMESSAGRTPTISDRGGPPAPEDVPPSPSGAPGGDPAGPQPQSGGAAATPGGAIPPKTPAQALADLQKSVTQSAEDRAGPQMVDTTQYVPNIPPRPLASSEFTPQNALDEKRARADPDFRQGIEDIERQRNRGMVDLLQSDAQDPNALEAAHEARSAVSPTALGVFDGQTTTEASGLAAKIDEVLAGPDGKRAAVRTTLNKVRDSLYDSDGNLETLPSQIYGARKNITDMLQKAVKGTGDTADDVRASASILKGLLPDVDQTITNGAPQFSDYLKQWSDLSRPINAMEFLQKYQTGSGKITDQTGYLIPTKVQKMLDDIYQGQSAPGVNNAKSLTDDQVQNVINVRNELATAQLRDRMAATRGSDTFQQLAAEGKQALAGPGPFGTVARGLGEAAIHGGLAASVPIVGNLAYQYGVRPMFASLAARRAAAAAAAADAAAQARKNALLAPPPDYNPLVGP